MRSLILRLMHHFHWHHMPIEFELREAGSNASYAQCTFCPFKVRVNVSGLPEPASEEET